MAARGLDDVIELLGDRRIEYGGGSQGSVELPWEIEAGDYLSFARADHRAGSRRGRVNALSNAKRALHCQIDSILFCTGFWARAQERRWDFNAKLDLLADLRIVAPGVLLRINRHRNEIEHEYVLPGDEGELADFLDVIELFVAGTRPLAGSRHDEIDLVRRYRRREQSVVVRLLDQGKTEVRTDAFGDYLRILVNTPKRFRRLQAAVFQALDRDKNFSGF